MECNVVLIVLELNYGEVFYKIVFFGNIEIIFGFDLIMVYILFFFL